MMKSIVVFMLLAVSINSWAECPDWLNQDMQTLRGKDQVNLCELKQDKVLLIVNTASECGYTPQFKGLEALYREYKDDDLLVIGFPSNSFWQEHREAEKTAEVCYINYGVTFPMMATSDVKGKQANPVFQHLAASKGQPKWNFYKYLVGRDGEVIEWYNSATRPDDEALIAAGDKALQQAQ